MALRLNLGSGSMPIPGFVNIDALPTAPGVDLVHDISQPLPFMDGTVDLIYASHVLEHFSTEDVPHRLADWRRALRQGGELLIAVPDLAVIAKVLVEHSDWFTPPHNPWLGALYGGQKDQYDFHKTGFTFLWLTKLLTDSGFGHITQVQRFGEVPIADSSCSPLPFGVNVSLNVRATAGGSTVPRILLERSRSERLMDGIDRVVYGVVAVLARLRMAFMRRRLRRLEGSLKKDRLPLA